MGLSASQARFLQLTARKSNVEYEAQQINFQRLQLSTQLEQATSSYQDKTSNRKLTFTFVGAEKQTVDITYKNYKNYMNQQAEGLSSSNQKLFLVSTSGNKIIVGSAEERDKMIQSNLKTVKVSTPAPEGSDEEEKTEIRQEPMFDENDFIITEDLDDEDNFQQAIKDGTYFFATYNDKYDGKDVTSKFNTESWETILGGAISEEYDKTDDKEAEATYDKLKGEIQKIDKKLELRLDQLETEREAIQTEMESVSKVIQDNVESSFKVFS